MSCAGTHIGQVARGEATTPRLGIVLQDGDSANGIAFPDAPGCFSAADSLGDLFTMAKEALGPWLGVSL